MKRIATAVSLTISACFAATLFAGIVYAGPTDDPGIQQREQNQQQRIQQGVNSGALTPRETGRLEAQQARITQNEARMKADGTLTTAERKKLTREQNKASKDIYRKKHNQRVVETK
jgi:hypothetical protein